MYFTILFEITQQKICINSKIGLHKQKKLWYDALAEKISAVIFGLVAQLGERSVRIREVEGSNPFGSTKIREINDFTDFL